MKKRIIALLCVLALTATSLTACSLFRGSKKTTINGVDVEEIQYHNGSSDYLFLVMTNRTGRSCDLEISVTFMDDNGNIVDTVNKDTISAFGQDTTVVDQFYSDVAFTACDYDIVVKPLSTDIPIDADLKPKIDPRGEDVEISVTNNSSTTAEFVEYYILYYKSNMLVDYDWGYCDDDDNEIKPGETAYREENCFEPYDNATLYIHGRAKTR